MGCDPGGLDPGMAIDPPVRDQFQPLLDLGGVFLSILMDGGYILPYSCNYAWLRFFTHNCICIIMPPSVLSIIPDHRVIHDGRGVIIIDNAGVNVGCPDIPVILHTAKMVLPDDNGMA